MNNIEILAPVGNAENLKAAVLSGADAVYFGLGNFNARRNAQNFTFDTAKEAIEYCHSRGVKVHITLNTLIKDAEIKDAVETVKAVCEIGADAIIVQDLGLAKIIKSVGPQMEIHASTQMTVGTLEGIYELQKLGFLFFAYFCTDFLKNRKIFPVVLIFLFFSGIIGLPNKLNIH